jgi:hypothetical protein
MLLHLTLVPYLAAAGELKTNQPALCEDINGKWNQSGHPCL